MRNPSGTEDLCVNCGKVIPVGEQEMPKKQTRGNADAMRMGAQQQEEGEGTQGNESKAGYVASGGKQSDASQLLADKMVSGWSLMAEYCPRWVHMWRCTFPIQSTLIMNALKSCRCDTSLVKKNATIYCVKCQMNVVRERRTGDGQQAPSYTSAPVHHDRKESHHTTAVNQTRNDVMNHMKRIAGRLGETSDVESKSLLESIALCASILKDLDGITIRE